MDTRDLGCEFYQGRNPFLGNENSNIIYRLYPAQLRDEPSFLTAVLQHLDTAALTDQNHQSAQITISSISQIQIQILLILLLLILLKLVLQLTIILIIN